MRGRMFYIFILFTYVSFICIYNLETLCICIFGSLGAGINERRDVLYIYIIYLCLINLHLEILCICIFGALGAGINERQEVPLGSSWQPQPHLTLPAGSDCTKNLKAKDKNKKRQRQRDKNSLSPT